MTPAAGLPRPEAVPGRDVALHVLRSSLEANTLVGLGGPPGVGKTTLAGAVARTSGRPVVAISLAGCVEESDVQRALGWALGVKPCADPASLAGALNQRPRLLFVVDDMPAAGLFGPLERALAAAPDSRALVISEARHLGRHLEIGDPSGGDPGTTARMTIATALGLAPEAVAETLRAMADVAALASLPMGVAPGTLPRPPSCLLRPDVSRITLSRYASSLLGFSSPPPDQVRRAVQPLLDRGRGAHASRAPDPRDLLLLRLLPPSAEKTAIKARLFTDFGEPELAAACLAGGPAEAATLAARADHGFATGDVAPAWAHAEAAAEAFAAAGEPALRGSVWRRAAERCAERGEIDRAEEAWRRARQAARLLGDDGALAAAMRGAAALAMSRGEWVGASALHEEAKEIVPPASERFNLRLGELTLALVRGETGRLRRGLDALDETAGDDELLQANLWRRRADARLREGDHEGARAAADEAADRYGALGEGVAVGAALRLGADAAALAGALRDADARYRSALAKQVATKDWAGLVRTLDHAALVSEAAGHGERARVLMEQRAAVQRVRGSSP